MRAKQRAESREQLGTYGRGRRYGVLRRIPHPQKKPSYLTGYPGYRLEMVPSMTLLFRGLHETFVF